MWEQQFEAREQGGQWRKEPVLPATELIASPYDLDARNGKKRSTFWTGYKVHFTQTCDEDAPQLITAVRTTAAPLSDEGAVSAIHVDLAEKELLPDQHLVDAGYVTIANLVQSQSDYEGDLLGPTLKTRLPSSGDRLRSLPFLHRLGNRDRDLPSRPDQFELDTHPEGGEIAHSAEILPDRLEGLPQPDLLHWNDPAHTYLTLKGGDASPFGGAPTRAHRCFSGHVSSSGRN
jgi:hypothetical protein